MRDSDCSAVDLSVVIPAFNEAQSLPNTLRAVRDFLRSSPLIAEILVVDDGSQDNTAEVASGLLGDGGRVISLRRNRGKGSAIRTGVLASRGETVLLSDADLSTPIADLELLQAARRDGADIAIGSRGLASSNVEVRQSRFRQSLGKSFNGLVRWIVGLPIADTQCGFKLFPGEPARALVEHMSCDGFAYDVELLLLCAQAGLQIVEVPVRWRNHPDSRVQIVRAPLAMTVELLRIRYRHGRYRPQ